MGSIPGPLVDRILRVGIIGCGEISQVAHIPNLNFFSHKFQTTFLCDVSEQALAYCSRKAQGAAPQTTQDARELCSSPAVDVVLIVNADAYHVEHGILALQNDKFCLIERPAAVCFHDLDRLAKAEQSSRGKVFVGTMRRYATAFLDVVEEVGGMDKIQYARVRDVIGPNAVFVDQSSTFPQKFDDVSDTACEDRLRRETEIGDQALGREFGIPVTPASRRMLRVLGGPGTHDLSAMREILGMPRRVAGATLTFPGIFNVLFQYESFSVSYESGLSGVPLFDAHIEVYSSDKIVRVNFDSPYVKGLPTTLAIWENVGKDGFRERFIWRTYEDAYTQEILELYDCVVNDRTPKTSAADARNDTELFRMILQADAGGYKEEAIN